MEKPLSSAVVGRLPICSMSAKTSAGRKTIVIKLSLEQLLKSGQDTIEIQLDGLDMSQEQAASMPRPAETSFFAFMNTVIDQLKGNGKERTAEAYRAAKGSLMKYRKGQDFALDELTGQMMEGYEAWLGSKDVKMNSRSFYMRILRAVYNRAVKNGMVADQKPFAEVYTGNAKTAKRAVGIETIRRMETFQPDSAKASYARDMFLFSFYTRGMSFVDMAYLRKSDLHDGVLDYCRRKTGQRLTIRWEQQMQRIVDRYPHTNDKFLLPPSCFFNPSILLYLL